jgi:hypothetical protein
LPETLKEQPEDNKTAQPRQDNVSMMQIKEDLIIIQQPEQLSSNTIVQRARGNSTTVLGEYREPLPRKKSPLKIEDELRGSSVTISEAEYQPKSHHSRRRSAKPPPPNTVRLSYPLLRSGLFYVNQEKKLCVIDESDKVALVENFIGHQL